MQILSYCFNHDDCRVVFARINIARAEDELKTFYSKDDLAGISIMIDATAETVPGSNMTVAI